MDAITNEIENIVGQYDAPITWPELYNLDATKLVDLLAKEKSFDCFNGYMHQLATTGRSFSYTEFAHALIRRSSIVGAKKALQEVDAYLNTKVLSLQYAYLLPTGIDENYTFSNDVALQDVDSLQDSSLRDALAQQRVSSQIGGTTIYSVLIAKHDTERHFYKDPETRGNVDEISRLPIRKLEDARLILSMIGSCYEGIPLLGSSFVVPKSLSFLEMGVGLSGSERVRVHGTSNVLAITMRTADDLLKKFDSLDDDAKIRFRVVLQRINSAKLSMWSDPVDACIDIRICIENLFLEVSKCKPIEVRLKKRMPGYTDYSKTRVAKIYSFLSTVVHTGKIPDNQNDLYKIIDMLQKVTKKFINDGGYPVWDETDT